MSCYPSFPSKQALVINSPFIEPHRPPISCAIVAEVFRQQGYQVQVLDLNIELYHSLGLDDFYRCQTNYTFDVPTEVQAADVQKVFDHFLTADLSCYEFIAISCFSYYNVSMTRKICEQIRQHTCSKIIAGGPGIEADNFGQKLYQEKLVDYYIVGEGELALIDVINGRTGPGINGQPAEQIADIENLPLPNYGYFDLARYDQLLDAPDVFIYGSRGCVRRCTFCDIQHYWPKFRWRTGKSIADEMIGNYEKYGIRYFYFADSLVNGNLKEFRQFTERLASYKENLFRWSGYAIVRPRGQHSRDFFDVVGAAGAMQWNIGVETGVDRIRTEMQKKFTNDDVDWHLEQSQRIGLTNLFLMMPTWHTETAEEHQEYLKIFTRWKNYAADGTIMGLNLSYTVEMLDQAPIGQKAGIEYDYDHAVGARYQKIAWISRNRPELTHYEKFRRTLAIYEEAIRHNWPINNRLHKARELKGTISNFLTELQKSNS